MKDFRSIFRGLMVILVVGILYSLYLNFHPPKTDSEANSRYPVYTITHGIGIEAVTYYTYSYRKDSGFITFVDQNLKKHTLSGDIDIVHPPGD